ncbi:MAG TPA: glycosyltransferase, partial [Opitutus sp.]|nr:glycosyltransferase [Opitutus sp.]
DESLPILRSYGNRLVLIEGAHDASRPSRENQANAVYRAFERSSGNWLFLLDGDDVFARHKIEGVLRALLEESSDVSLVQSTMTLIDEHGRPIGQYRDLRFHQDDALKTVYEHNDVDFFYPTSAMVLSRPALARVLPLDMTVCPELACDTRIGMLMPLLGRIVTIDQPLACWRRHRGSYISALGQSRWFSAQQTIRRIRTFNHASSEFAAPKISFWRNARLRRQIAGALLPESIRRRWRPARVIFHGKPANKLDDVGAGVPASPA